MKHQIRAHQRIDTPPAPRDLEVIVRRLWTTEPISSAAERTSLLTELASIGLNLERIILREELRCARPGLDDDRSSAELAECDRRIQNLLVHWPRDVEARSPPLIAA